MMTKYNGRKVETCDMGADQSPGFGMEQAGQERAGREKTAI